MVGGQGQAVDWAHTLGLAEAQGGRDPQLEAQPHHQPVYRSCPWTALDRAGIERANYLATLRSWTTPAWLTPGGVS